MSKLLNSTVTHGIKLSALTLNKAAVVGYKVSRKSPAPQTIPLTINKKPASLFLYIAHTLVVDDWDSFLANTKSTYSLQFSSEDNSKNLLTYDYVRDPPNEYPAAHLHVYGSTNELEGLIAPPDVRAKKVSDLHIPVGGRRFRPSLEDLIEFCIVEDLVKPRPNWDEVVEESRNTYRRKQFAAAVRRSPDDAIRTLHKIGWTEISSTE